MINSVRTTVQAIANKHNYGYLTPSDGDLFMKQAQLEEFEDLIFRYTQWQAKRNAREASSDLADIPENIRQDIEVFETNYTSFTNDNGYYEPPSDLYYVDPSTGLYINGKPAQKISRTKALMMEGSDMIQPSKTFPSWSMQSGEIRIYPTDDNAQLVMNYIRYPKDPQWGYVTLAGGEPVYNASSSTDLELPKSYFTSIVIKVCGYLGINIREQQLVEYMNRSQIQEFQVKG